MRECGRSPLTLHTVCRQCLCCLWSLQQPTCPLEPVPVAWSLSLSQLSLFPAPLVLVHLVPVPLFPVPLVPVPCCVGNCRLTIRLLPRWREFIASHLVWAFVMGAYRRVERSTSTLFAGTPTRLWFC